MDTALIIREFKHEDLPSLTILTNELGYPTTESEMRVRIQNISQASNYRTIVAEAAGQVVGYMGMSKNYFWEQNGHYIRIQALVVKKESRGSGAGKKLIGYAENWARETGAGMIFLNCGNKPEREGAHKFYPKIGFEARSTGYVKRVNQGNMED